MYFPDNSGKCIEQRVDLNVFNGEKGDQFDGLIEPLGRHYSSDSELEYICRTPLGHKIGVVLKTVQFSATVISTTQYALKRMYLHRLCILYLSRFIATGQGGIFGHSGRQSVLRWLIYDVLLGVIRTSVINKPSPFPPSFSQIMSSVFLRS